MQVRFCKLNGMLLGQTEIESKDLPESGDRFYVGGQSYKVEYVVRLFNESGEIAAQAIVRDETEPELYKLA